MKAGFYSNPDLKKCREKSAFSFQAQASFDGNEADSPHLRGESANFMRIGRSFKSESHRWG